MTYLEAMRASAEAALDSLHHGVTSLLFTQFPDHANVGDSAIALGQDEYWRSRGIAIEASYSVQVTPRSVFDSRIPVLIHGGGNFGGLYPSMSRQRNELAAKLPADTLLLQAPQSVHFTSDDERTAFERTFGRRENLRIAVRDMPSQRELAEFGVDTILAPDSVHLLGSIAAKPARQEAIVLARRDKESNSNSPLPNSVDWIEDPPSLRVSTWLSWRASKVEPAKRLFHAPHAQLMRRASTRLARGVEILSIGETIVTDRLHAALIGLQMGRRVLAVDNNNAKLSSYADTWHLERDANFRLFPSLRDALDAV